MGKQHFSVEELHRLRNDIHIDLLIEWLKIPFEERQGLRRFRCPTCQGFHTATHPKTNLARCFDCKRNYNTIELVMVTRGLPFVAAVKALRGIAAELSTQSRHPVAEILRNLVREVGRRKV